MKCVKPNQLAYFSRRADSPSRNFKFFTNFIVAERRG